MSSYIIIDSREKPKAIGKILEYFDRVGIDYEVSKLLFGDYMDWNRPGIVVDRKQNIADSGGINASRACRGGVFGREFDSKMGTR